MSAVKTVHAYHLEVVEIQWHLPDGSVHIERYTVPPKSTREARKADAEQPTQSRK